MIIKMHAHPSNLQGKLITYMCTYFKRRPKVMMWYMILTKSKAVTINNHSTTTCSTSITG